MAKRPEKKREPAPPAEPRVLPMQLQIGDRLTDETGKYEVVARPYTTAGGKTANIRVKRVDSGAEMIRVYGAHERVAGETNRRRVMATTRRSDRPGLLLWLNTTVRIRARLAERLMAFEEMTVRPEDTLLAAGISSKRQARYQRRMSSLLAKRVE
jgi:hypothetical protein